MKFVNVCISLNRMPLLDKPITSLKGPLFTDTQADVAIKDLDIEALLEWPATATLGVGATSRCAYDSGDATRLVDFHNATGKYTHGQPIATACTYWGQPKCSRTVTIEPGTIGQRTSYTANRGFPPCNDMNNVPAARIDHTGMFTVRIWGKLCFSGSGLCQPAREPVPAADMSYINTGGYFATFKGGGKNCGPPIWPTPELRATGTPPYAAYCDFTFDIR